MPPVFKTLISLCVWLLFVKGLLLIPVTIYTFGQSFLRNEPTPIVGVVSCAAGTLALVSSCVAAWVRRVVE